MRRIGLTLQRLRSDERGVEAPAMIIVLPILFILIIGLVDVGWMLKTRMVVDSIISTAVKQAAAEGGNYNPQTMPGQPAWSDVATRELWRNGSCTQSSCDRKPTVDCTLVTRPNGTTYRSNVVQVAGDVITCTVKYPYKPISGALLTGPLGLGIGGMLHDFTLTSSARSELGTSGY